MGDRTGEHGDRANALGAAAERRRFLCSLRAGRAASFRSEIVPYFRYVLQSGFGLAVSAALFALIFGYARLLSDVPADFPAGITGSLLIWLASVPAPLRTYLKPADPVFLLPMESAVLRDYIRPALTVSVVLGILRAVAAFAVFLPLYISAPATQAASSGRSLALLGLWFAALGAWNAAAGWRERQIAYGSRRLLFRSVRYAAVLASSAALLTGPPLPAWSLSVGMIVAISLIWRFPRRHVLPWDTLIGEEAATRRRWFRFLSWFVDVPSEDSKPAGRKWAAWMADLLPWQRERAWHYLYAKTFIRGETFGALTRWYAVIVLVVIAADNRAADWFAFAIGCLVGGVQLGELAGLRFAASVDTLPIEPGGRRWAAAGTARIAGTTGAVVLWLLTAVPEGWPLSWLALGALALALWWSIRLIPRRIAKPRDEDED